MVSVSRVHQGYLHDVPIECKCFVIGFGAMPNICSSMRSCLVYKIKAIDLNLLLS
jgi:hypothetical protein